jgi:hypothetical protein
MNSQQEIDMPVSFKFIGDHAHLASEDEISHGVSAAMEVFSKYNADPLACAAANDKVERDELINREEAELYAIWETADDTAFRAITVGWLIRDIDIRLALDPDV